VRVQPRPGQMSYQPTATPGSFNNGATNGYRKESAVHHLEPDALRHVHALAGPGQGAVAGSRWSCQRLQEGDGRHLGQERQRGSVPSGIRQDFSCCQRYLAFISGLLAPSGCRPFSISGLRAAIWSGMVETRLGGVADRYWGRSDDRISDRFHGGIPSAPVPGAAADVGCTKSLSSRPADGQAGLPCQDRGERDAESVQQPGRTSVTMSFAELCSCRQRRDGSGWHESCRACGPYCQPLALVVAVQVQEGRDAHRDWQPLVIHARAPSGHSSLPQIPYARTPPGVRNT